MCAVATSFWSWTSRPISSIICLLTALSYSKCGIPRLIQTLTSNPSGLFASISSPNQDLYLTCPPFSPASSCQFTPETQTQPTVIRRRPSLPKTPLMPPSMPVLPKECFLHLTALYCLHPPKTFASSFGIFSNLFVTLKSSTYHLVFLFSSSSVILPMILPSYFGLFQDGVA